MEFVSWGGAFQFVHLGTVSLARADMHPVCGPPYAFAAFCDDVARVREFAGKAVQWELNGQPGSFFCLYLS